MTPRLTLLTAISGFVVVSLGALGAHALEPKLIENGNLNAWSTAAHYHLLHTVACLAVAAWAAAHPSRLSRLARIQIAWLLGCLLFSGSIYVLALGGPKIFGPITPLGGVGFLIGWILLALETRRQA
ncbi:MAG: DUF423 domain-containing protein [Opitutaceae bacterium]|nr:DUF423 domain-containing protein [Opitutaceae bacterium]